LGGKLGYLGRELQSKIRDFTIKSTFSHQCDCENGGFQENIMISRFVCHGNTVVSGAPGWITHR